MKKIALVTITFSALLQSCGQHKAVDSGKYQTSVKLGKFSDNVTSSTFAEDQLKDLPRAVDLKDDMSPVKNQSDRGSCTFFSTAAMLEATIKKDMEIAVNLSEEFLNYSAKSNGYFPTDEGSTVLNNIYAVRASGIMLERDSAFQPTWFSKGLPCEKYKVTDVSAPVVCFSHNAPDASSLKKVIKADNFEFAGIEKNTNDIIRYLAEEKRPVTVAIVVNFNGWPQTGDTFYNEDLRKECLADPDKCGGHSVLLTGYDLDKGVFFFKNSWGADWGQAGYGTMTIESLDRYAESDFYSAKLKANLDIPADHKVDSVALKNFSFKTVKDKNNKLSVNLAAEVSGAKGHLIYISTFLAKKNDGVTEAPGDANTHLIQLTAAEAEATGENAVRAFKYVTAPADNLAWTSTSPLALNFLPGVDTTFKTAMDTTEETLLRTTIYVHTDDSTFKVLERIYSPITK
ncbi:MAG: C1 family peptidase [Bacteriovorax sp.]|nr:C1 family peptidase [Bacteriovorax sp.]